MADERIFCSRQCHYDDSGVEVDCAWCGETKTVRPSRADRGENHFCGRDCLGKYLSEVRQGDGHPNFKQIEVACDTCGRTFMRQQHAVESGPHVL